MFSVRTLARTHHFPSSIPHLRSPPRFPTTTSIRVMSSSSSDSTNQIIEHIVLFKAKPTANPTSLNAMINNLNTLSSLDPVLHLSAGPILNSRSHSNPLTFTHILHSRYKSKHDLATYTDHPQHVSVVSDYVKPNVDDVMALDWVSDNFSPRGGAFRLTVLKMKDGVGENGKSEVMGVLRGVKDKFGVIEEMSVGENFSPGRAKGYEICSMAVFKGVEEMELLDGEMEKAEEEKGKVREFLDGVLVFDFVVGAPVQAVKV